MGRKVNPEVGIYRLDSALWDPGLCQREASDKRFLFSEPLFFPCKWYSRFPPGTLLWELHVKTWMEPPTLKALDKCYSRGNLNA